MKKKHFFQKRDLTDENLPQREFLKLLGNLSFDDGSWWKGTQSATEQFLETLVRESIANFYLAGEPVPFPESGRKIFTDRIKVRIDLSLVWPEQRN